MESYNTADYENRDGTKTGTLKKITKLGYGYSYGPFTDVFGPDVSNAQMAAKCTHIIDSLKNNRSVAVIGYGISGSSKTTTIIDADYIDTITGRPVKEPGIILHICKNLVGVDRITVSVREIFSNRINPANKKPFVEKIAYNNVLFIKSNGQFVIDQSNNFGDNYWQRIRENKGNKIEWKDVQCIWSIQGGVFKHNRNIDTTTGAVIEVRELGSFLTALITKVRIVRPTPNNPESSRSHVLAHLKMKLPENTDDVFLTIVDAAGVENKFTCEDPDTKKQFLNLKLPKEAKPYYVKEQYRDLSVKPTNPPLDNKIFSYFGYTKVEDIVIRPAQVGEQSDLKVYLDKLDMLTNRIDSSYTKFLDPNSLNTAENIKIVNDLINNKITELYDKMPLASTEKDNMV